MGRENVAHGVAAVKRLVVFAPNWLGDAVMALPAIADIRRAMPASALAVAARPSIAPLFEMVPGIDEVVPLTRRQDHERVRQAQFDAALLLPNSLQSALTVWRAGIPERWGYRTDWRGPLLTRAVPTPGAGHQALYYQRLVRALGIESGPLEPALVLRRTERQDGEALLRAEGWDGRSPLVALAPGAAYGGAKRWPPSSFAALAQDLAADGVTPVLIGGPADEDTGDEVLSLTAARDKAIDLVGRTDLPALAGVLAHCRALVTNDSGAMHLAAALNVPVTALFGPTDETATHPLGPARHEILINPVWCRPCMLRECPLNHQCMRGIDHRAALTAARRAL